jgi:hypothetical protein
VKAGRWKRYLRDAGRGLAGLSMGSCGEDLSADSPRNLHLEKWGGWMYGLKSVSFKDPTQLTQQGMGHPAN